MEKYSISNFIKETTLHDSSEDLFLLKTSRLLEVSLDGYIWAKLGTMKSYLGHIKFYRDSIMEHGLERLIKKSFTGEGTPLMKAVGSGKLFLADEGKKIIILNLEEDSIIVNGNNLLAFESSIHWDIKLMRKLVGALSGGLFNVKLSGNGLVALTSHFDPITLLVTPDNPVFTTPTATVAWSGNLTPDFVTDISLRTFVGRGNGQSIQMKFSGSGFVVVQPYRDSILLTKNYSKY